MDIPLFLGYTTAAFVLLHNGFSGLHRAHALPAFGLAPKAKQVKEAKLMLGLPNNARLDTCVLCETDKRAGARQRAHKCRFASAGDYLSLGNNIYIASPQLTFLQCAEVLTVQELTLLGLELCGSFVFEEDGFSRHKPLSSKQLLMQYVKQHSGERGTGKALEALRFIADGSASPRESQLVALLCMPQKWGGYGFPIPALNSRIDLTSQQRRVIGKSCLYCDVLWERPKLAIEYDSDLFHAGATKINDDSLRRNILRATGITVIDVTNIQLKKAEAFHEVAIQVDHFMSSHTLDKRKDNWSTRNRDLRHLILTESAHDRLL